MAGERGPYIKDVAPVIVGAYHHSLNLQVL